MKKELTFSVSDQENHDLKSLLMSMKASLMLLEKRLSGNMDEKSHANLDRLKIQLDTVTNLMVDILKRGK